MDDLIFNGDIMVKKFRTPEGKAKEIVLLRANQYGSKLYCNNSGTAYTDNNRPVFFGLGNDGKKKTGDIRTPDDVGFTPITITPEMVGKTVAVFTAIDSKKAGFTVKNNYNINSREYGQNKFFQIVIKYGGIAGFACNAQQVDDIYNCFNARMMG